jgi:hypothetical protein
MTRDEVLALITQAANADTAPAALNELTGAVNELFTTNETLTQTVQENETTIANLRDTNMRLFLAQTEKVKEEEPEPEKTAEDYLNELVEKIMEE